MTIDVHLVPGSPFGRSVLAVLEEKHAPYRILPVAGGFKSPSHLAMHPFGRIPVIEHDGFVLFETQAILRYIDRLYADPSLTPSDIKSAARMDEMMNINDWYVFQGVGNVIGFERIVKTRLLGQPADEKVVEAAMPRAKMVYQQLNTFLSSSQYFAGNSVSLADFMIAPQVDFLRALPEWPVLTDRLPDLVNWLERMNMRASMTNTTTETVVRKMGAPA